MKKKVLKKMFALLLAGTMVMSLAACGKDDTQEPSTQETNVSENEQSEEPGDKGTDDTVGGRDDKLSHGDRHGVVLLVRPVHRSG